MKSPIVVKDTLYEMRVTHEQLLLIENAMLIQYDLLYEEYMFGVASEDQVYEYFNVKYTLAKINEITKSNRLTTEHKPSNMFYIRETKLPEPFDKYDV